jgi:hypothetical protein
VPSLPFLCNVILEFLDRKIRQEEVIKGIKIGKETVTVFLFANDMILYLKDSENSTQKLLYIKNNFSILWQDTKSNYKNH